MAIPAGLEPATLGLGNRCSIQLSYGTMATDLLIDDRPFITPTSRCPEAASGFWIGRRKAPPATGPGSKAEFDHASFRRTTAAAHRVYDARIGHLRLGRRVSRTDRHCFGGEGVAGELRI